MATLSKAAAVLEIKKDFFLEAEFSKAFDVNAELLEKRPDVDSQLRLAYLYDAGMIGGSPNYQKAEIHYRRAAARGNSSTACVGLGLLYLSAALTTDDSGRQFEEGMHWLRTAAELDRPEAKRILLQLNKVFASEWHLENTADRPSKKGAYTGTIFDGKRYGIQYNEGMDFDEEDSIDKWGQVAEIFGIPEKLRPSYISHRAHQTASMGLSPKALRDWIDLARRIAPGEEFLGKTVAAGSPRQDNRQRASAHEVAGRAATPLSVPDAPPKLYVDRPPGQTIIDFLRDMDGWGPYVRAGVLTRPVLRRLDPQAEMALRNWLRKNRNNKLPPDVRIPTRSDVLDAELAAEGDRGLAAARRLLGGWARRQSRAPE